MEVRKVAEEGGAVAVLVAHEVDAQARHEPACLAFAPGLRRRERLEELPGAAPDGNPQRARVVTPRHLEDPVGRRGVEAGAHGRGVASPGLHPGPEGVGRRVAGGVPRQVGADGLVGVDQPVDPLRPHVVAVLEAARGEEALDLQLVRVDEEADEALLVVGVPAHVGQHDQAGRIAGVRAPAPDRREDEAGREDGDRRPAPGAPP